MCHWPRNLPQTKTLTNSRLEAACGHGALLEMEGSIAGRNRVRECKQHSFPRWCGLSCCCYLPTSILGRQTESGKRIYLQCDFPRGDSLHFVKIHCVTILRTVGGEVEVPRCDSNKFYANKD